MKYTEADRIELARWLMLNAHRLSKRTKRRAYKTDAEERWAHARNLLWSAARKLRAFERTDDHA